jgi:hypothetical protein
MRKLFREEILLFEQPSPFMFSVTRKEDHLVAVKIFNSLGVDEMHMKVSALVLLWCRWKKRKKKPKEHLLL